MQRVYMMILGIIAFVFTSGLDARADESIPPQLRLWSDWVLQEHQDLICPVIKEVRTCVWPGELSIQAQSSGAEFELSVYLEVEAELRLPGNRDHWPQEVLLGGKELVVSGEEYPHALLPAGKHTAPGW